MNQKSNNNKFNINSKYIKILITAALVILAEIFIFNFRFFQSIGYEPVYITNVTTSSDVESYGSSIFHFKNNNGKIYLNNINKEIKNIYIDVENTEDFGDIENINDKSDKFTKIKKSEENKLIKISIKVDDESNSNGINMPERKIVSTIERTKYIPLKLNGMSENLSLEFKNAENKSLRINNIILNNTVPFNFNILRVITLLLIIALIYVIRPNSTFYQYALNIKSKKQKAVLAAIVIIQSSAMICATHINPMYVYNTVSWQTQYIELSDAILDGHFYIEDRVDEKLIQLDNPYDPGERDNQGVSTKWDHAYYDGKYYIYFGIVPALLFNIPLKLIADIDIMPFNCILILIPIFVIMGYFLIYEIAKKFISNDNKIPLLAYIMLSALFTLGTGVCFLMVWPDMYTLPIFTAVTLGISGLYCWLTSIKPNKDNLSKPRLFIGSLLMALIAGCRPQLLLVLFLAIPIFYESVFKKRKLFSRNNVSETACFAAPIILFALFMFYYNYARFGSIFDFGSQYNITTNDMTVRSFDLGRVFQGMFYYFLQPLNVEGTFPYITTTNFSTNYMGITIKEGTYGGVLFLMPVVWMLFALPKVKNELKEKSLFAVTLMLIIFAIVIAFADAVMAGILSRYFIDFSWLLVLGAVTIIFALYYKNNNNILNQIIPVYFIVSLFITGAITIGARYYSPMDTNPETFWSIASAVQFWM